MIWECYRRVVLLVFVPALVVHELAHLLVGSRWADGWQLDWDVFRGGRPVITWEFPDGLERWKIVAANLAPLGVGITLAPAVFWIVSSRGLIDPVAGYVGLSWIAIALPSGEDLSVIL